MGEKFKFSAQDRDLAHFLSHKEISDKKLPLLIESGVFKTRFFSRPGSNTEHTVKQKNQLVKKTAKIWAFNSTLVKTLN